MSVRWDAVVVGARVAGAATAMLLARSGMRVLCVDRAREGSDTLSTHAFLRAGVLQLAQWGLVDEIRAAGTPPIRRIVFTYGDEQVPVAVRPGSGVDALYAPRRTVLDTILSGAAVRAGATVRYGTPVTGLLRGLDGRVSGVVVRGRDGRMQEESAPLVIGADGRASVVADEVAAPVQFAGTAATEMVYGYAAPLPVDGYVWSYRPGVSVGAIPTNGGVTCIFAGGRPGTVLPLVRARGPEGTLRALAATGPLGPALAQARTVGRIRHVHGTPGHLRTPHGPGWALVGDAGYWKDPLSTHGMSAALRDADLLARAVLSAPRPGRAQTEALAGYAASRDALSLPMLRIVERIAAHDWDLPTIRQLLLEMSSTMADEVAFLKDLATSA